MTRVPDHTAAWAEMLAFLTLTPAEGDGHWSGPGSSWGGQVTFGGLVIAQAIMAATREVPEGTRLHSLHAYFLRPVATGQRVDYQVDRLRAGRSFTAGRLRATQSAKATLDMSFSLTADGPGYVYDLPANTAISPPQSLPPEDGPGPWEAAWAGPSALRPDGTRESTHRAWYRIPLDLPDDVHLHTASSASPPTGPAPAAAPCTWMATPEAWSAWTTPCGSTARLEPTSGSSTTCTASSTPAAGASSVA